MSRLRLFAKVCSLLLSVGGLSCASSEVERTEIMLVVDSDLAVPAELDEIAMHVEGPNGVAQDAVARLSEGALPRSLGLVRKQGPLGPLNVLVTGRVAGQAVLERKAVLAFVEGRTLVLPLHLVRACVKRSCGLQTCGEQGCVDPDIDPQSLTEWTGSEPPLETRGDVDAGAAPEGDAAVRDGATLDAASDAAADAARDAAGDAARDAAADAARDGGSCQPTTEQCNGRDDDCDGVIDDGFRLNDDTSNCGACGNACPSGARACCNGTCRSRC